MFVYVVTYYVDYETNWCEAVFDSKEKAIAFLELNNFVRNSCPLLDFDKDAHWNTYHLKEAKVNRANIKKFEVK